MPKFLIIGVLALAIVGGFLFWKFGPSFNQKPAEKIPAVLTIWGLWEDESLVKSAIEGYKKDHPDTTITYAYQTSQNYRSRVQAKIAGNEGPDIFMIHNTWVPMFLKSNSLSSMPLDVMTTSEYAQTFNPIVKDDFTNYLRLKAAIDGNNDIKDKTGTLKSEFEKQGKIYAVPRGIDGLVMFYNEDLLKNVGATVPATWNEFKDTAKRITVADQNGVIQTAGAAMGTTGNVDHFSDILGLLFFQQPTAKIEAPYDKSGTDVLRFYTSFVTDRDNKVWDTTMAPSTQTFASGKLAFYFAPSWRAHELRQLNPELKFKTAPVPQLSNKPVAWATYWGYAVSSKSKFPKESWEFLKYFSSKEVEKSLYQEASKVRLFGLPYSRVDLQKEIEADPLVGAVALQAPFYKSWYLSSNTKDQGVNDQIIKYYEDAVNATLQGGDLNSALETTQKGIEQVLGELNNPASAQASPAK